MKNYEFKFTNYSYDIKESRLDFYYTVVIDNKLEEVFHEILILPKIPQSSISLPPQLIDNLFKSLHLILGISYYKLFCPTKISIGPYGLSDWEADFWNKVYTKGLGEFFFKNNIDFRRLINFPYNINEKPVGSRLAREERFLVALGGGKDSIVTLETLKKSKKPFSTFTLGQSKLQNTVSDLTGSENLIVKRYIDKKIISDEAKDRFFTGHVPSTAIYSFIGILLAVLYDYKYVVFSNEASAEEGNRQYLGETINHQWSKSIEFENMLRGYLDQVITRDIEYFSLLRPLSEIEIVRRFVKMKKYLNKFASCNSNFKNIYFQISPVITKNWCSRCAKCFFVFCLLSAFLKRESLLKIFKKNLYDEPKLEPVFRGLVGLTNKPFDCVGTASETIIALYQAYKRKEFNNTYIMKIFISKILPKLDNIERMQNQVFSYGDDSNIPAALKKILRNRN